MIDSWEALEGKKLAVLDSQLRAAGRMVSVFEFATGDASDFATATIVRENNAPFVAAASAFVCVEGRCTIEAAAGSTSQVNYRYTMLREVGAFNRETRQLGLFNNGSVFAVSESDFREIDSRTGQYYVSARNDGGKTALLLGPFEHHIDALLLVSRASMALREKVHEAVWYAYGTVRSDGPHQYGRLNDEVLTASERAALVKDPGEVPDMCFIFLPTAPAGMGIKAVRRGESGYLATSYGETDPEKAKKLVDFMNGKLGVSEQMAESMLAGSMFGWDAPAANPDHIKTAARNAPRG